MKRDTCRHHSIFLFCGFRFGGGGDEKVALVLNYSDVKCKRQEKSMISRNLAVASYSKSVFIVRTVIDKNT